MNDKNYIASNYWTDFPIIRIKKATLRNFRDIEFGEIIFNCEKTEIIDNEGAEILGIYGQNGSGKTGFIEALDILKHLMAGKSVSEKYADCIAAGKDYAELEFVFDLQYADNKRYEATYSFCMTTRDATIEEVNNNQIRKNMGKGLVVFEKEKRVIIFNERLYLYCKKYLRKKLIIDTSSETVPFLPDKNRLRLASGKNNLINLMVNKESAKNNSQSFIFKQETLEIFLIFTQQCKELDKNNEVGDFFCRVLFELNGYAKDCLFVLTTDSSALIRINYGVTLYSRSRNYTLSTLFATPINKKEIANLDKIIKNISIVLNQLVPGLTIELERFSETLTEDGEPADCVMLIATRDEKKYPLRYESDGVRRLVSFLCLIISVFNDPSVTLAIDEFDAGIFEYLLGEILQALEEYGSGQFIFTSHNLRPLEVINKKFLCFTTTDPKNRYVRLKNIAASNNLRDTYFRKIMFSDQKEELYKRTKQFKIVDALMEAGGGQE